MTFVDTFLINKNQGHDKTALGKGNTNIITS